MARKTENTVKQETKRATQIFINGKFWGQRVTGVQRYAREIVAELDKVCQGLDVTIVLPKDAAQVCPPYQNIKTAVCGKKSSTLWEQTTFARYVRKHHGVSVNLCNAAPLFAPKIVCVHDMKAFAHPEYFTATFRLWYHILFRNIMKKAKAILTVSEFSKREILKYFPKMKAEIYVAENAWQHFARTEKNDAAPEKYGLKPQEYFFALSSLEPNKNLKWIIGTAQNAPNEVFAVAGGLNSRVFAEKKTELPPNVKLLGYVSDEDSAGLMQNCKAFLFVTFYEGFGIPPLEALSAGAKCVIVSDTEVMHEVLGENAVYVSPQEYCREPGALAVPVGNACLEKYSWERSAQKLLEVLKKV